MFQIGERNIRRCSTVWRLSSAFTLLLGLTLNACDGDLPASTPVGDGGAPSLTDNGPADASAGATADAAADVDVTDAAASGGAGSASASSNEWCAARAVLQEKCQRCHAAPPAHGAPFPLVTYADTQLETADGSKRSDVIKAVVEVDYMPPTFMKLEPPVAKLTPSEKAALLAWLAAPLPAEPPTCE